MVVHSTVISGLTGTSISSGSTSQYHLPRGGHVDWEIGTVRRGGGMLISVRGRVGGMVRISGSRLVQTTQLARPHVCMDAWASPHRCIAPSCIERHHDAPSRRIPVGSTECKKMVCSRALHQFWHACVVWLLWRHIHIQTHSYTHPYTHVRTHIHSTHSRHHRAQTHTLSLHGHTHVHNTSTQPCTHRRLAISTTRYVSADTGARLWMVMGV